MKLPDVRYTIKRLMIGIAVLAVLLAGGLWAVELMSRPIPLPRYVPYKKEADEPANLSAIAVPANAVDSTFLGTVTSVDPNNTDHPFLKWVVTLSIDKVDSGPSPGKSFWFAIHSPSQEGVKVGQRYRMMVRKNGGGYELIFAFGCIHGIGSLIVGLPPPTLRQVSDLDGPPPCSSAGPDLIVRSL